MPDEVKVSELAKGPSFVEDPVKPEVGRASSRVVLLRIRW